MMKIHTTQNLNSIREQQSTSKSTIPLNEIRLNYSELMRKQQDSVPDTYESNVSFKGKKEIVGKITKAAVKETWIEKMTTKFLKSRFFDKMLDLMSHEVFVQALISAVVCMAMRPLTIMAIPTKKNKQDNMYASAHSMASGFVGIVSSLIIATPFSKGIKYSQNNHIKDVGETLLKRKYPNLNLESIWADAAKTIRKPVDEWKDIYGNKFSKEYKDVMKVAEPKHISEISEKTLKTLGADVDLNAMKGKSVNDWVDRAGKKVKFSLKDMFIAIKEDGMGGTIRGSKDTNFFSLQHVNKDTLQEVMPNLDINSIEKDGKRLHTDFWKNKDGSAFKLDLDTVHLSSYRETSRAIPLYTGEKRFVTKDGKKIPKYVSYQSNNGLEADGTVPEKLGSPVLQKYLDADLNNTISNKTFTWLPDIVTRIPVAAGTIYLIPWVLKNIFHIEKSKKTEEKAVEAQSQKDNNIQKKDIENKDSSKVSFKGSKESAFGKWIGKVYGNLYGKHVLNSNAIQTLSEKLAKAPGEMTEHMTVLGSILTSSTYMYRTWNNKDLDKDKRKTLTINQALGCIIPTIGGYTVSKYMVNFKKHTEYDYCGLKEQQIALGELTKEEAKVLKENFGPKLKALSALTGLATFTLIYRYITPVVITPVANWIGNKINAKDEEKAKAKEIALNPDANKAKEISIDYKTETRKSA